MWNWTLFYLSGDSKTPFAVIPNVQMRRLKLGEVRYGTHLSKCRSWNFHSGLWDSRAMVGKASTKLFQTSLILFGLQKTESLD